MIKKQDPSNPQGYPFTTFYDKTFFPVQGKPGVVYVDEQTGLMWRWGGTDYVPLGGNVTVNKNANGDVVGLSAGGLSLNLYAGKLRGGRAGMIGDSITAVGGRSVFHQLCILSGGKIWRAVNAGVAGNTTAAMAARIATDLPKSLNLDLIFVTGGTNDAASAVPTATVMQNLLGMVLYARSIGADAVLVNIPPKDVNTAAALAIRAGYVALAAEHNIPLIDPWAAFIAPDGGILDGSTSDGVHPDVASTLVACATAWGQLEPMLADHWNGLDAISGVPGAQVTTDHFFPDSDANGIPNGFTGYALSSLVSTKTVVAGEVGNKFRIETSGLNASAAPVAGEWVAERVISGLTLAEGDRIAIVGRLTMSGFASGIRSHIKARSAVPSTIAYAMEPTWYSGDFDDQVVYGEGVVPAGGLTAITLQIRLATTGTVTPSVGYIEVSQVQVWNLTAIGIVG